MEYFEQIPLCEITKYLDDTSYCNLRLVNQFFNNNIKNEYDSRRYTFLYMIKHIDIWHITKHLDYNSRESLYDSCEYLRRFKEIRIFATNYNVLRIMSGMSGLCYSN